MAKCSSEFVMELMDMDLCKIDVSNKAGETPLFLAAASGKPDVMKKLVLQGKGLNAILLMNLIIGTSFIAIVFQYHY